MSIASIPGAVSTDGPKCVLHVLPRETRPERVLEAVSDLVLAGHEAQGWHPWWGDASRMQRIVELATGQAIDGCPFIVEGKGQDR